MSKKHVRITKRSDRGFHQYGKPFRDSYDSEVEVYESSSAKAPHVWVAVRQTDGKEAHMHLTEKQAFALVKRLRTWMDEIPRRWAE
jgi:hypothetical protein